MLGSMLGSCYKGIRLSYYNKETILFAIDPYYGNYGKLKYFH